MGSDFKEVRNVNTMRCPKCEWVSATKVLDDTPYIGLMFHPCGDYFICTNPACGVERIYGENAIIIRNGNAEGKKEV
jgi:hypothetical protein